LQGNGTLVGSVSINSGGTIVGTQLPGPARLTVSTLNLLPNGRQDWPINSATGGLGLQVQDYTQSIIQTQTLNLTGLSASNRFTVRPVSLRADNQAGSVSDFDATQPYTWTLISYSTLSGIIDPTHFTVDASQFSNSLAGGTFGVGQSGSNLVLQFTPVPEPGGLLLIVAGVGAVWRRRQRVYR
jgi:hypothetical protein